MIKGFEIFHKWFYGYKEQYAIIGGTACDLLMTENALDFRATKDIDLVLIIEALTLDFGNRFWEFIIAGGYQHLNKSTGVPEFYRFSHPQNEEYPFMIELFSRRVGAITLPRETVITPIPMEDSISSLSAILLDDAYYELLRGGTTVVNGVTILDAGHLILFKAKAWLDLTQKKEKGEQVDSKNIRKHKKDIFRLSVLLNAQERIYVQPTVRHDMLGFLEEMRNEDVDLKQLGIANRSKDDILDLFLDVYHTKSS
jgi:hypothetical protein